MIYSFYIILDSLPYKIQLISFRIGNSFSTVMVDLVLGVLLLIWMYSADLPVLLADIVKDRADVSIL